MARVLLLIVGMTLLLFWVERILLLSKRDVIVYCLLASCDQTVAQRSANDPSMEKVLLHTTRRDKGCSKACMVLIQVYVVLISTTGRQTPLWLRFNRLAINHIPPSAG